MKGTTEELVKKYKEQDASDTFTQKQRAEMETALWALAPAAAHKFSHPRASYLIPLLGPSPNINKGLLEYRASLYQSGKDIDLIWAALDQGRSIYNVGRLVRTAKRYRTHPQETLEEAIKRLFEESEKEFHPVKQPSGRTSFRKPVNFKKTLKLASKKEVSEPVDPHAFFGGIRSLAKSYVKERLTGVPEIVQKELVDAFEIDLKVLFSQFAQRVRRSKSMDVLADVERQQVLKACGVLGIKAPKKGLPVELPLAKKQARTLMGLYHPDKHDGDASLTAKFNEAREALEAITQYNSQLEHKEAS